MAEKGHSKGHDPSTLIDSLKNLSLSKSSITSNEKDQGIDVCSVSSTSSDASTPSPTRSTLPPLSSSSIVKDSSLSNRDVQEVDVKNTRETVSPTVSDQKRFTYVIPFPDEPIIDVMKFGDLNLDRTFATETSLTHPQRVGYFSCHINADGKTQSYRPDKSSLRYLYFNRNREVNLDLLADFSPGVNWGRVPAGEMHILRWFSENAFDCIDYDDEDDNGGIDFICYTRMLRSIMNTPYNRHDDWICIAIKVNGSIILDEIDTLQRQVSTSRQTYHQQACSYSGYKFEERITRRYDGNQRPTHAHGNRDSFYIVSKAKLNKHNLLYCNRVDCATNKHQLDKPVEEMQFAQIKTRSENYQSSPEVRKFFWRMKVISWWTESMLGKIDYIYCGERDDNFFIRKFFPLRVDRLPKETNRWSPRTCVSFLDLVLTFIKSMVTDELTPYRFYCIPGKAIICQKIDQPVENFLPSWFINSEQPKDD